MANPETSLAGPGRAGYRRRIAEVWRLASFRWFWVGTSTQGIAQGMQFLVIGWLVLEVTGSSAQLGLVISLYGVPNVASLVVAGVLADRFDRRYVLISTQAAVGVLITVLALLTVAEMVTIWHIYASAVLLGIIQALNMPARMTMVADLVEPRSLLDAVAMQNAAVHAGRIVGPAVVGAIIEFWGVAAGLFVITGCYVVSMACIAKIGRTNQIISSSAKSPFRNFADGLVYIKNNPLVLTVIVITCSFGGFGMSHMQVIPAMAKEVLGTGAAGVGLLLLASGVGSLIGTLFAPLIGNTNIYRSLLVCLVVFTVVLTLFAWSTWFWVSWTLFLLVGVVSLGLIWTLSSTLIQLETPLEMRGRVMGILQFTPGFHYLGALPLALAAGQWGWGVAITGAAVLSLSVTVWFALVRSGAPKLRYRPSQAV